MRAAASYLLWGPTLIHAALNLDGTHAVAPAAVEEDVPSPIGNPDTYLPDLHDCPLPCADYSNIHSWTPYISVERLRRCEKPMLLKFSVRHPLDDPDTTVLIRGCTLGEPGSTGVMSEAEAVPVENPKKSKHLSQPGLHTALACTASFAEVPDKLALSMSSGGEGNNNEVASLLEGMQEFFDNPDNCNENFLFAYYKQTVASVYVGARLGKSSAVSALDSLAGSLREQDSISNSTVVQICGSGRRPERVLGIAVDATGDLAGVQKTALKWSRGTCVADPDLLPAGDLHDVKILEASGSNNIAGRNGTFIGSNETFSASPKFAKRRGTSSGLFWKRDTCRYISVDPGDGCWSLSERCGITTAELELYNPKSNLCDILQAGDYVCCSPGDPFEEPRPDPPQPDPDGTCATHLIFEGDTCDSLASQYGVEINDILAWNNGKTWAWTNCEGMLIGYNMCVSDGLAPMPPPQAGTECGPLVPGTERPADPDVSLADINPCPLKACCSNWGFCGVFPGHCNVHAPPGGGPGSKSEGYSSTCVSNCGTSIRQNSGPPAVFSRVGYYEAFNLDRDCLWMKAKNANVDGAYTHLHWGFGAIDPATWKPIITEGRDQWEDFKKLADVKRIVSFGGWAYSTEAATYNIIRQAIIDHPETFAANLAQFVEDEGIDGVDIDWEYPGVSLDSLSVKTPRKGNPPPLSAHHPPLLFPFPHLSLPLSLY